MAENESTEKELLKLLAEVQDLINKNPATAEKVSDQLANSPSFAPTRELLFKRRSEQMYYSGEYGEALIPYLEKLEADSNLIITFDKKNFRNKSVRTIYLMVYQAWQWLRDQHPEKERFIALYQKYKIAERPKLGSVRIIPKTRLKAEFFGELGTSENEYGAKEMAALNVQEAIDEFLKKEMTQDLEILELPNERVKRISLSESEIEEVKDSMAGLEGITAIVEHNRVKVLRRRMQ